MKLARDTWLVFQRALGQTVRNPTWVVVLLAQPLMFLYLFGPLLKGNGLRNIPNRDVFNVFVPGLLVQLAMFGTMFVGFGLVAELRYGVIERFRVTPISRVALLLGRSLRDVVALVVQAMLLMLLALPLGLHIKVAGMVVMVGMMVLLGLMFSAFSYALAMMLKSEDALAPLMNMLSMPLLLLSGILIPMTFAPRWLRGVSKVNPVTHVVDAARQLFQGHVWNGTVATGVIVGGVLAALTVGWASRLFNKSAA
jgi:ABC-2 type transport system permease protein